MLTCAVCCDVIRMDKLTICIADGSRRSTREVHDWANSFIPFEYRPPLTALRRHFYVNGRLWRNGSQQWHVSLVRGSAFGESSNHSLVSEAPRDDAVPFQRIKWTLSPAANAMRHLIWCQLNFGLCLAPRVELSSRFQRSGVRFDFLIDSQHLTVKSKCLRMFWLLFFILSWMQLEAGNANHRGRETSLEPVPHEAMRSLPAGHRRKANQLVKRTTFFFLQFIPNKTRIAEKIDRRVAELWTKHANESLPTIQVGRKI